MEEISRTDLVKKLSIAYSQGGEEYAGNRKKKKEGYWIGHIWRENCLLKHVIGRKIEGRIGSDGKRRKKT